VIAPQVAVAPGMDSAIIVSAFIVAVIGGLGSVTGAALGALIIGAAETLGTIVAPTWASAFIYLAMIVVLVARPSGLLGIPERQQ
jgi:branched-chain amino acid transport system permease protein